MICPRCSRAAQMIYYGGDSSGTGCYDDVRGCEHCYTPPTVGWRVSDLTVDEILSFQQLLEHPEQTQAGVLAAEVERLRSRVAEHEQVERDWVREMMAAIARRDAAEARVVELKSRATAATRSLRDGLPVDAKSLRKAVRVALRRACRRWHGPLP